MITSRGLTAVRLTNYVAKNLLLSNVKNNVQKQITRGGHGGEFYYKKQAVPPAAGMKHAEFLGTVLWWWITWHVICDYHELLVPDLPNLSELTDEELGIPPDDAD